MTSGTAQRQADAASAVAVTSAMTPYCVGLAQNDPRSVELLAELKATRDYDRTGLIEKAGWATPMGADKPNTALAQACKTALIPS